MCDDITSIIQVLSNGDITYLYFQVHKQALIINGCAIKYLLSRELRKDFISLCATCQVILLYFHLGGDPSPTAYILLLYSHDLHLKPQLKSSKAKGVGKHRSESILDGLPDILRQLNVDAV